MSKNTCLLENTFPSFHVSLQKALSQQGGEKQEEAEALLRKNTCFLANPFSCFRVGLYRSGSKLFWQTCGFLFLLMKVGLFLTFDTIGELTKIGLEICGLLLIIRPLSINGTKNNAKEICARMDVSARAVALIPRGSSRCEVAELLNLQAIREQARKRR